MESLTCRCALFRNVAEPLAFHHGLCVLAGERIGVFTPKSLCMQFGALDLVCQPCISIVHRRSTQRQFHIWKGPSESLRRRLGETTKTRSRLRTSWSVCERRFVHNCGGCLEDKTSCTTGASREGLVLLKLLCSVYVAGVRTRWKKLAAIAITADSMTKTGGKFPWENYVVKCDVARHIRLKSTATVMYNNSCKYPCCW